MNAPPPAGNRDRSRELRVFSAKTYERESLLAAARRGTVEPVLLDVRLGPDTAELAAGAPAVSRGRRRELQGVRKEGGSGLSA